MRYRHRRNVRVFLSGKFAILIPRGVLPNKEVGGGGGGGAWTSHQVWRQNLGQGPAKFTK